MRKRNFFNENSFYFTDKIIRVHLGPRYYPVQSIDVIEM